MPSIDGVFLADEILKTQPWDTLLAIGVLATIALVPLVILVGNTMQRKRTERLREEFGPDYETAVNEAGNWREAEKRLVQRRKREGRRRQAYHHQPR